MALGPDLGLSPCSAGNGGPVLHCLARPSWGHQIRGRQLVHPACPAAFSIHQKQLVDTKAGCCRPAKRCPLSAPQAFTLCMLETHLRAAPRRPPPMGSDTSRQCCCPRALL